VGCEGNGGTKVAERQTQKKILQLLQQVGPTKYQLLWVQFEFHNGYLQDAVEGLLHDQHIVLDSSEMVHITDAGYRLLDNMKYWSEL
jgi:hypothetical protein